MTGPRETSRVLYLEQPDVLLVLKPGGANAPEIYLAVTADGGSGSCGRQSPAG